MLIMAQAGQRSLMLPGRAISQCAHAVVAPVHRWGNYSAQWQSSAALAAMRPAAAHVVPLASCAPCPRSLHQQARRQQQQHHRCKAEEGAGSVSAGGSGSGVVRQGGGPALHPACMARHARATGGGGRGGITRGCSTQSML